MFHEIPNDIKQFMAEIRSSLEITSSREFLCSLLNEVSEQNWHIKDNFKEWKVVLEKEIHQKITTGQSRHIMDLDRLSNATVGILEPFIESSAKVFTVDEASEEKDEKDTEKKEEKKDESDKALTLNAKEKALFLDTTRSSQRLMESLKYTHDLCTKLNEFYRFQSEEAQNNTLKTLTVITSTVIPMQLSTGVFGMNFETMPELPYEYSYLIFWLCNFFIILCILAFWRSRGFI